MTLGIIKLHSDSKHFTKELTFTVSADKENWTISKEIKSCRLHTNDCEDLHDRENFKLKGKLEKIYGILVPAMPMSFIFSANVIFGKIYILTFYSTAACYFA